MGTGVIVGTAVIALLLACLAVFHWLDWRKETRMLNRHSDTSGGDGGGYVGDGGGDGGGGGD